jgi:hypothetical protein
VALVDHRIAPGHARRPVVLPVEGAVDDHALGHRGGAVAAVEGVVGPRAVAVAEDRRLVRRLAGDRPRPGVDEQLGGVEAMAVVRLVGPVDAVAVELAGADAGHLDAPHAAAAVLERHAARRHGASRLVEERELDRRGVARVEGEANAAGDRHGAEGCRLHGRSGHPIASEVV